MKTHCNGGLYEDIAMEGNMKTHYNGGLYEDTLQWRVI